MDVKLADDHKLVELWKQGNEAAYNLLFNKYFAKLYHYTLKFISDKEVAEEIVMDVMFNIWQKKHLVNNELPVSAYLFRSVKNKMIDHYRKNALKTISINDEDTYIEISSHMRADDRLMHIELERKYMDGLCGLSPQKKVVFELSREEGLTYNEIAQRLNISKNTVENHMVAALKQLKTHINY
ncbi:RNA polymerase sigma-70 factor [Mucilaginibacter sp. AW1-3]